MSDDPDQKANKGPEAGLPKWVSQVFKDFLDHQDRMMKVLDLSRSGIRSATVSPEIVEFLARGDGSEQEPTVVKKLQDARAMAEFAQREIDNDFPVLHAQAVVSLWGSLETLSLTVVADWIMNSPEILHQDPWRGLKVKVGEYETLDGEQKASHLASSIDQGLGGPLKSGVTRFESLLETVGLKGSVSDEVRRGLWELHQIRNGIVHKRGKADRKFCDACPWLGLEPGTNISVTSEMYKSYYVTSHKYVVELICRAYESFGFAD